MAERIETDSTVDLQVSIDDSVELGAAAEFLEASDVMEDQFAVDENASPARPASSPASPRGDADQIGSVADSLDNASATQRTPLSGVQRGLFSSLSSRILPSWLDSVSWPGRSTPIGNQPGPAVTRSLSTDRSRTVPKRNVSNITAIRARNARRRMQGPLRGTPCSGSLARAGGNGQNKEAMKLPRLLLLERSLGDLKTPGLFQVLL